MASLTLCTVSGGVNVKSTYTKHCVQCAGIAFLLPRWENIPIAMKHAQNEAGQFLNFSRFFQYLELQVPLGVIQNQIWPHDGKFGSKARPYA